MVKLQKKDVRNVIIVFVVMNIIMALLLFSGNLRFFSKNDSQIVNYTIDHIDQRQNVKSLGRTKYSVFIDENGKTFEKRSTINDYVGRSVPMYTNGSGHARVDLEITDIGGMIYIFPLFELCMIYLIVFSIRNVMNQS